MLLDRRRVLLGEAVDAFPNAIGRTGRPEEVAAAIAFLLSPPAAAIVGACLFVDGGTDAMLHPRSPEGWEVGIRLHRRIDALTDHHPTVAALTTALPDHYRRFAGIMLDVCFDHCLSLDWPQHEAQPLADFSQHCYHQLLPGKSDYPATAARQIYYLARYDVLTGMDHWPQIEAMLERIDQRFRRPTPLAEAGPTLARALPTVREGFAQLYPALIDQLSEEFSAA